jgi:hypothetical protein
VSRFDNMPGENAAALGDFVRQSRRKKILLNICLKISTEVVT